MKLKEARQLLNLMQRVDKLKEEYEKTLPYKVNLIEEMGGACEDQHSNILASLLGFKSKEGRYEILENIINHIADLQTEFVKIKIKSPQINVKYYRYSNEIDIYIRETGKYAIIIENKSNKADDGDAQLARYIDVAKSEGFKRKQIYVIYLPYNKSREPKDKSWGNYKKEFESRFANLSWQETMLSWLRDSVLLKVSNDEVFLKSAVVQYISFWESEFGVCRISKEVEDKMKLEIDKFLSLDEVKDPGAALKQVSANLNSAKKMVEIVEGKANSLKADMELAFWNRLEKALTQKKYKCERINLSKDDIVREQENRLDIKLKILNRYFYFSCYSSYDIGCYGFLYTNEDGKKAQSRTKNKKYDKVITECAARALALISNRKGSKSYERWFGLINNKKNDFRKMSYEEIADYLGTPEKVARAAEEWADKFDKCIKEFKKQIRRAGIG